MKETSRREKGFWILILGFLLSFFVLFFSFKEWEIKLTPQQVAEIIRSLGAIAPIIYLLVVALNVIIPPITHVPFTVVFLEIFGFFQTIFFLVLGNLFGSFLAFLISRCFGRPAVIKLIGEKNIRRVDRLTTIMGWQALLVLRLFAGPIFDLVSYAAGLTSMPFFLFFLITSLAVLPGAFLFLFLLERSYLFLPLWLTVFWITTSLSLIFLYHWGRRKVLEEDN